MSLPKRIAEFPDVEAKLQKPTKQSAFERQKAEAEAKRLREEAETAAVYEDFIKSFDADKNDNDRGQYDRGAGGLGRPPPPRAVGGSGRRHFGAPGAAAAKASGPGTLGPAAAPTGFGKKRTHDGFQTNNRRDHSESGAGRLVFDDPDDGHKPRVPKVFDASDEEDENTGRERSEEKAVARPTLRLANLPPATSPAVIKALLPPNLVVENVRILPPTAPGGTGTDRKSIAAIVTLSQETAASEIDATVSALQNRYLGFGHYLSLHRHLSSTAIASASVSNVLNSTTASQPFGAKPVVRHGHGHGPGHGFGNGPNPGGRFAPPSSYGPSGAPLNRNLLHVPIQPPRDIKQLRMIHKVIESVLEHGPEFEALLMSRPDVQRNEKWAWIWDARSQGGIWYRWRLWEILTGVEQSKKRGSGKYLPLFDGGHAWKVPDKQLAYEYTTGVSGFVSESEYDSEYDDEDEDEPKITTDGNKEQEEVFLNPIEKAKLVHLLSRLPTTLSKIRKGDIARITSFAITHANGADEIVDLIITNLEKPLTFSSANPDYKTGAPDQSGDNSRDASPAPGSKTYNGSVPQDISGAKIIGLYVISDILSSSSTSGIRHAWRYRQLFEAALKARKSFEGLGSMPEKMKWGRLRAEKWKRSVGFVLSLWDGWCVFPNDSQELFVRSFENPPSEKEGEEEEGGGEEDEEDEEDDDEEEEDEDEDDEEEEDDEEDEEEDEEESNAEQEAKRSGHRWKTADASATTESPASAADVVGEPAEHDTDSDGSYDEYTDDEEADNELLAQYSIDGEPLLDIDMVGLAIGDEEGDLQGSDAKRDDARGQPSKASSEDIATYASSTTGSLGAKRKRMTAADMFADSDGEGG